MHDAIINNLDIFQVPIELLQKLNRRRNSTLVSLWRRRHTPREAFQLWLRRRKRMSLPVLFKLQSMLQMA